MQLSLGAMATGFAASDTIPQMEGAAQKASGGGRPAPGGPLPTFLGR